MGFSAADAVTGLKLVEAGVPKEKLALLAVPMVPLQILLPLIISKYTAGPRPLDIFYKAFPFRLAHTLLRDLVNNRPMVSGETLYTSLYMYCKCHAYSFTIWFRFETMYFVLLFKRRLSMVIF
jgi:PAT family acetyl-CoA transporter-like MFS transporter 1